MNDPSTASDLGAFAHAWLGAITVLGGIVAWFTRRLIKDMDGKADQKELDALKLDFKSYLASQEKCRADDAARQDRYHLANTTRLDNIFTEIARSKQ